MAIENTVDVHEENVTMAVIIRELPDGRLDAHVKGHMAPLELVDFLREIAEHIETNGPVDAR